MRVKLDKKPIRSANKRWDWLRRGAPILLEVGPRDMASDHVTLIRRDKLRDGDKVISQGFSRSDFLAQAPSLLAEIQANLYSEAKARLDANIRTDLKDFDAIAAFFGAASEDDDAKTGFKGWVRAPWARPTGAELEAVEARLKALKLTLRNVPVGQGVASGVCVFTGRPAVEEILIARAY
jgi:prolyl-tRNA synthetase